MPSLFAQYFSSFGPQFDYQFITSKGYFDISFCIFYRCSAPCGGAFNILTGILDVSHSNFDYCESTSSFNNISYRATGGSAFVFYGQKASCSFITAFCCSNNGKNTDAIIYLAAKTNDNMSVLSVSCSSMTKCHTGRYVLLLDYGFDIASKSNISFSSEEMNSPVIHFGHDPSLWNLKDCVICNYLAGYGFYGSSMNKKNLDIERLIITHSENQNSLIGGNKCNIVVSNSLFIENIGKLCIIDIDVSYSFFWCVFEHYSETWQTNNCLVTNEFSSTFNWGCFYKFSKNIKLNNFKAFVSLLLVNYMLYM